MGFFFFCFSISSSSLSRNAFLGTEKQRERPKTNILFCNLLTLSLSLFLSLENAFNEQIRREKEREGKKNKKLERNVSFLRSGVGNKNERKEREIEGEKCENI